LREAVFVSEVQEAISKSKVALAFALRVWENPAGENRTRSDRSWTKYKDFVGFVPVLLQL
jgi:hypothetical protein